ncbi:MAG: GTP 3',8-cyclase MoaA [Alphaproteobacteria bacterium CG_4_10_14_0_2_um_filter_63_37]|nr:MAG: cyclic pyranopterin phosphate synthase MoaA [Proteobacteria bacterium CG1_02_64_396]PJA23683.1 MAG: GTP 3',8-cyclase MoaA [Alphaproteobacteria bacterium CG_4_10_14_0_2_um_filter_63_37]
MNPLAPLPRSDDFQPGLIDPFGRKIGYLRLSVIDRCDLRCRYCLPERYEGYLGKDEMLPGEQMVAIARAFMDLGVQHIRITGGEPLLRPDLLDWLPEIGRDRRLRDLSLTTNATHLAEKADALRASGVKRLNVSLDSLRRPVFADVARRDRLPQVLEGLVAAKRAGFERIKINTVVMRGVNDDQIPELIEFCAQHGHTLRLIETMPMGVEGFDAAAHALPLTELEQQLAARYTLEPVVLGSGAGPARYFRVVELGTVIGLITPLSRHFCESCNRVRVSAKGELFLCLGQEDRADLAGALREGGTAGLRQAIAAAVARKPKQHDFNEHPGKLHRAMAATGG